MSMSMYVHYSVIYIIICPFLYYNTHLYYILHLYYNRQAFSVEELSYDSSQNEKKKCTYMSIYVHYSIIYIIICPFLYYNRYLCYILQAFSVQKFSYDGSQNEKKKYT